MASTCFFVLSVPGAETAAEEWARPLCGAEKLLLASQLYAVTAAGQQCGGRQFAEGKDISPENGRAKRGTGINARLSSSSQEGKLGVKSNFHFNLLQRRKTGHFKWLSRVITKSLYGIF